MLTQIQDMPTEFASVTKDAYNAYHISLSKVVSDQTALSFVDKFIKTQAQENINKSLQEITTAVWVILADPKLLHLVSPLCKMGLNIHNAIDKKITLYTWISRIEDQVPAFSVFTKSCGAVLINNESIFLVCQRTGHRKGLFNIPCGRADPGETIHECIQRQLYQETSIKAKFRNILQIFQTTHSIYKAVDQFYICLMKFKPQDIANIKICQNQLTQYRWVPLSQYVEFASQKSGKVHIQIAKYITKLWKEGFDFNSNQAVDAKSNGIIESQASQQPIGQKQVRKAIYYQPTYCKKFNKQIIGPQISKEQIDSTSF